MVGQLEDTRSGNLAEKWQPEVVVLARELKSLVGRGVTQSKAASGLANLRRALGVPDNQPPPVARRSLKRRLNEEIHNLAGEHPVFDPPIMIPADKLIQAYSCLFHLVTPDVLKDSRYAGLMGYDRRRLYAIHKLEVNFPLRSWRLPDGPEFELMLFFAQRLAELQDDEGFVNESAELLITLDELGVSRHVTSIGRLRATRAGVDHGVFHLSYKPDPRPDVYEIEAIEGFTRLDEHWNDALGVKVVTAYFRPLQVDDSLTYAYRLTLHTDKPTKSMIYHAPSTDYKYAKVQASFSELRMPSVVWWFERLSHFDIPGEPEPGRLLTPKSSRTYAKEFEYCPGGYCCGIGWRW